MKIHIRSTRLYNNAGISFPICQLNDGPLDLDKTNYFSQGVYLEDNLDDPKWCKHCVRKYRANNW